jgi:hypothetical protein
VNPFSSDGSLVLLSDYPGLANHLQENCARLKRRHVAGDRPGQWYRTIDRVWSHLTVTPKLLARDIQPGGIIGFDLGAYYPHHNLYWITSRCWNLRALQTILRSALVTMQVRSYSVQMRGGNLRYQAQTLRRLRVPHLSSLPADLVAELALASSCVDQITIDELARRAFALSCAL